jgi:hypothetical protein
MRFALLYTIVHSLSCHRKVEKEVSDLFITASLSARVFLISDLAVMITAYGLNPTLYFCVCNGVCLGVLLLVL